MDVVVGPDLSMVASWDMKDSGGYPRVEPIAALMHQHHGMGPRNLVVAVERVRDRRIHSAERAAIESDASEAGYAEAVGCRRGLEL